MAGWWFVFFVFFGFLAYLRFLVNCLGYNTLSENYRKLNSNDSFVSILSELEFGKVGSMQGTSAASCAGHQLLWWW